MSPLTIQVSVTIPNTRPIMWCQWNQPR
jgi:hypothetical protein